MSATIILQCAHCGASNRAPEDKLALGMTPKCGRCKRPLQRAAAAPLAVTDATFAAEVERSPLPVLVDAWAAWCGPCRALAPAIDELAGEVRVVKLDVDENPATASRFAIRTIPTLLVIRDGKEVDRIVGVQPKAAIRARLERAANARRD